MWLIAIEYYTVVSAVKSNRRLKAERLFPIRLCAVLCRAERSTDEILDRIPESATYYCGRVFNGGYCTGTILK
jgi:hypothetical protein